MHTLIQLAKSAFWWKEYTRRYFTYESPRSIYLRVVEWLGRNHLHSTRLCRAPAPRIFKLSRRQHEKRKSCRCWHPFVDGVLNIREPEYRTGEIEAQCKVYESCSLNLQKARKRRCECATHQKIRRLIELLIKFMGFVSIHAYAHNKYGNRRFLSLLFPILL